MKVIDQNTKDTPVSTAILDCIRERLPVIDDTLRQFGDLSLEDYFRTIAYRKVKPLQVMDDLLDVIYDLVAPVLGKPLAEQLAVDIRNYPVVMTANHHGNDYFAQSFQSNLLFLSYRRQLTGSLIAPIFSGAGVPLSNSSYPRGLLVYDAVQPGIGEAPFKLPLFSKNLARTTVCAAPPFTRKMVEGAFEQLDKSLTLGLLPLSIAETIREILNEEYLDDRVLNQTNYSTQAMILNNRLAKRVFTGKNIQPEVVYLAFENIVTLLLKKDLSQPDSLAYRVFFDDELRRAVIANLDGKRGCWRIEKLREFINQAADLEADAPVSTGFGSVFFWGLDTTGVRFPLTILDLPGQELVLEGIDNTGNLHRIPMTPAGISEALETKTVFPSIFTVFMAVSLARAVECIGGYFQGSYLPAIQAGVVQSLLSVQGYQGYAEPVAGVVTNFYLSGMMFLLAGSKQHIAVPAGPLEIINRGCISWDFLRRAISITVEQAHKIGLFNIYPDIFSRPERLELWQERLASELYRENSKWILPEIPSE